MSVQSFGVADKTPIEAVLEAVSTVTGIPVMDLPPLYDQVDPDALNQVLSDCDGDVEVGFEYYGMEITVTSDEVVIKQVDRSEEPETKVSC